MLHLIAKVLPSANTTENLDRLTHFALYSRNWLGRREMPKERIDAMLPNHPDLIVSLFHQPVHAEMPIPV